MKLIDQYLSWTYLTNTLNRVLVSRVQWCNLFQAYNVGLILQNQAVFSTGGSETTGYPHARK